MASSSTAAPAAGPNTEITIKIHAQGITRKLKLPLKDLVPSVLPHKLRTFLGVHPQQVVVFERFSDSSANYVNLDATNVQAYKTLYRAAKAKLKLRLRAHVGPMPNLVTAMDTLAANAVAGNSIAADYASAVQSLANLNFGSSLSLDPLRSAPEVPNIDEAPPSYVPAEASRAPEQAAPASVHEPIAAAIASFCQNQSSTDAKPLVAPTSIQAKTEAFAKTIREMDEELKLRINAHIARQAAMSKLAQSANQAAKEATLRAAAAAQAEAKKASCPVLRMSNPPKIPEGATFSWSVYCNHCNKNMLEEHFHCNSCESGDYDLCTDCMAQGKHCLDEKHWLIKRFLRDGKVINGETHKVVSSPKVKSTGFVDMPGAFNEEKKPEELKKPTRTCNCCVTILGEDEFVNCADCKDYDLCIKCLQNSEHGHHPGHTFVPATDLTKLTTHARALCKAGRNVTHAALCDECDSRIVGVRYKCLVCPDWDYCSACMQKSSTIHRGHRFAPVYDSITPQACQWAPTHAGVYCDGPLCKDKNAYISGIRYKCAVCPDLDFCAGCESLPNMTHNKTHPLLKFRTPVRGCSVTTMVGEDQQRNVQQDLASKTQICTVAEVKPTDCSTKSKETLIDEEALAHPVENKVPTSDISASSIKKEDTTGQPELQAHFVRDSISDGTTFEPQKPFVQVWTLRNPGPDAWPAGCSVRWVGGDLMLNLEENKPSTNAEYENAVESNVVRRPVEVGEEIAFRILMKAPKREGVAISYWRLKTPEGVPFGHRLWCHVTVKSKADEPEVGRLGSHDAFLRYSLNEQVKREHEKKSDVTYTDATIRDIAERLKNLRAEKRESSVMNGDSETSKPEKAEKVVKIEVIDSTDVPALKNVTVTRSPQKLSFPTLDVESSASSAASEQVTTNAAAIENVLAVAPAPVQHEATIFDDAESITVAESIDLSDDSSDDGFMTEDEYDILDASDQEIV